MKIIPAIDILDGKCVRLSQGNYQSGKIYHNSPLEVARMMEDHGLQHLHLVDLDGARSKHIVNHKVLEAICTHTRLQVDFGGGIKTTDDVLMALDHGAVQVTAGSIAVQEPELFLQWLEQFGPEQIILGADCRNRRIAVNGWQQQSTLDIMAFIASYYEQGVQTVICTDIARDGMLEGPPLTLYSEILSATPVSLIASGGISNIEDLETLKDAGCAGAIIGKAIYENRISLKELSRLC